MTAITTTTVTGRIALADDSSVVNGQVHFLLTGYETDAGSDVTIVHHVVSADIDASGDISIDLWPNADGSRGTWYTVTVKVPNNSGAKSYTLGRITVPESGPVDLNDLLDSGPATYATEDIAAYNSPGSSGIDSLAGLQALFDYAIPNNIKMIVRGDHYLSGTVTPNGKYHCEWVNARLFYSGSDPSADLTEVQENPSGASYSGAGKYVLFDVKGCEGAVNTGSVEIIGGNISDSKQATLATIPADIVAITASELPSSPEIQWGALIIRGCDRGLFQGDMSGTATAILPYTRWVVQYLEIKHCLRALDPGAQGNGFDEFTAINVHLARNDDNGVIRTDWAGTDLFIKGKRMPQDAETPTVTTVAGDATVEFSAAHGLSVGDVIAIDEAGDNLDSSDALIHVTRVDSVTDTDTVEVETAPRRSASGVNYIVNPPSLQMSNGDLVFSHIYIEECHDTALRLNSNGKVWCPDIKFSDGDLATRDNIGIHLTGITNMHVDIGLNQRAGITNSGLRHLVGIPAVFSGTNVPAVSATVNAKGYTKNQFTKFSVYGCYAPEDDLDGGYTVAAGAPTVQAQYLEAQFAGQKVWYQAAALGEAQEMKYENGWETLSYGSNLRSNDDMTGTTTSGADVSGPTGGVVTKVAGAVGYAYENISVTANDRLRIDYTATVTARGITLALFNSGGGATPAGNITQFGAPIKLTGGSAIFIDVPASTDRIGWIFSDTSAGTVTNFIVRKLTAS
jgi:hypothetical protein